MIEETWDVRELPILRAIYRAREDGAEDMNRAAHEAVPELNELRLVRTLADLTADGYLKSTVVDSSQGIVRVVVLDMTAKGLRTVGAWPSGPLVDEFVRALQERAAAEDDPEQRKALSKVVETLTDLSKGVLASVLTYVLTRGH